WPLGAGLAGAGAGAEAGAGTEDEADGVAVATAAVWRGGFFLLRQAEAKWPWPPQYMQRPFSLRYWRVSGVMRRLASSSIGPGAVPVEVRGAAVVVVVAVVVVTAGEVVAALGTGAAEREEDRKSVV